jgi:hypothetical protein
MTTHYPSLQVIINTGAAYLESYKKYVKIPGKQVLLLVMFYIDGAATAQFLVINFIRDLLSKYVLTGQEMNANC